MLEGMVSAEARILAIWLRAVLPGLPPGLGPGGYRSATSLGVSQPATTAGTGGAPRHVVAPGLRLIFDAPAPSERANVKVMKRQLLFDAAARESVLRGATLLANAVRVTLGPRSKCVLIDKKWGEPIVCNDGVTIAKELELDDPTENLGARMIRQAAERTGEVVGDGTTTATLLAHAIFAEGVKNVAAGASAIDLKRGLDRGLRAVVASLVAQSPPGRET